MLRCPGCGEENPAKAKFCLECGTKLTAPASPRREVRKTVTVLFSDVTGSTALGEQLDPESLRTVMGRYFGAMKAVIERHGGTVEKFIGDAIMAVFGIPTLHEDDALRAVRAAAEMRDALEALNRELEAERGMRIAVRTGVNTGEVVAGDPAAGQTLVTGDTVNTAARLEQAAGAGEILLGEVTQRLVRDAVTVEPVPPVEAKGKALPVPAYRLIAVTPGAAGHARRLEARLIGREEELGLLRSRFERVVRDRSAHLVTILGTAGVGKSRLVAESLSSIGTEARVLKGRCLAYGEGITYWPIREIVHEAAGITEDDDRATALGRLRSLVEGEREAQLVGSRVATALGLTLEAAPQEELFWAIRRLLEHLARERPLVVLVEDIHWAEPTLLDLLEYLVDLAADAPLLIICPARPELNERRAGWMGGKPNATTLALEGLPSEATEALLAQLPGGAALPQELRARIAERAEGNPLFLEEMLAMLRDEGRLTESDGTWVAGDTLAGVAVPASIGALVAARIDALPAEERAIAERASVMGRSFETAALRELAPGEVSRSLLSLVRKELLRPDRAELSAGDAFKFRHILIRDAAYQALPKTERAELHERFADWLERVAGDRLAEYQEIIGYHLEQAHRYREQLGESGERVEALRRRAGGVLAEAGRQAYGRGDALAAARLLEQAAALLPVDSIERVRCLVPLADAVGDTAGAEQAIEIAHEAAERAEMLGEEGLAWQARVVSAASQRFSGGSIATALEQGREAVEACARLGDALGEARAHKLLSDALGDLGRSAESIAEAQRGAEAARRAGDAVLEGRCQRAVVASMVFGPTEAGQSVRWAQEVLARLRDQPRSHALVSVYASLGYAMLERFEEARSMYRLGRDILQDLGDATSAGATGQFSGWIELWADDAAAAERALRPADEQLEEMGERPLRSSVAAFLAEALARQGRFTEAERGAATSRELADPEDYISQVSWRGALALCLAAKGRIGDAETMAREAVAIAEGTDDLNTHGHALLRRAEVVALDGRGAEARASAEQAIALFERKGNLAALRRARGLLKGFDQQPPDG